MLVALIGFGSVGRSLRQTRDAVRFSVESITAQTTYTAWETSKCLTVILSPKVSVREYGLMTSEGYNKIGIKGM